MAGRGIDQSGIASLRGRGDVIDAMRGDLMPRGVGATHQRWPLGGIDALEEEGRAHFLLREYVEDTRRVFRVRPVIEGQGDAIAILGRLREAQQRRRKPTGETQEFHGQAHGTFL
jgi:hypothetical protein